MKDFAGLIFALILSTTLSPGAEGERPPNIFFAIADDWGLHASAYGAKWVKTPAFDRVAKEGLLFTRAYTPNAKCAPSRASILTGRNSWQLKAAANHIPYFPPEFKVWPEALAEKGWFVGHTQKGWGPGVATNAAGENRPLTGKPFNAHKLTPPARGISNNDYAANFAAFLDAREKDQPWAFWYGAIEPHRGYEFGVGVAKGGKELSDIEHVPGYWPDNEIIRNDMLDYAFEVEHFDQHLGRMLEELDRRGLLENTIVIVTSDHGMPFPRVKGQTYEHANHVPLAMMWKNGIASPGRTIDQFVSFVDIAPTVVELAGLQWSQTGMAPTPGQSWTEFFAEGNARPISMRDHVLLGRERQDIGRPKDGGYPVRGIATKDFLYLHNFEPSRWPSGNPETGYLDTDASPTKTFILQQHRRDPNDAHWEVCFGKRPAEELYDLRRDPDCINNLAQIPEHGSTREQLKARLFARLKEQGDPRMRGEGHIFDEYPHANEGHRNFYERYMSGEKMRTGWVLESDYEKRPERSSRE